MSTDRARTCDLCRTRKVKCVPLPPETTDGGGKCKGCYNLDQPCVYNYVVKRAGRKTTRMNNELRRSREQARSATNPTYTNTNTTNNSHSNSNNNGPTIPANTDLSEREALSGSSTRSYDSPVTRSGPVASLGQGQGQGHPPRSHSHGQGQGQQHVQAYALPTGIQLEMMDSPLMEDYPFNPFSPPGPSQQPRQQQQQNTGSGFIPISPRMTKPGGSNLSVLSTSTGSGEEHSHAALSGLLNLRHSGGFGGSPRGYGIASQPAQNQGQGQGHGHVHPQSQSHQSHHPTRYPPQHVQDLEDLLSWSNAAFFLRLYLKYQHALMPLVHKPSFAKDMVDRRDRGDEVFRGMLFSLIAHVISQVPKSKMITHFTQPELERLQLRCHQASRVVQVKYHNEPSLELIVVHYADVAACTTLGKTELAGIILAEGIRMAYSLGLHRSTSALGGDFLQTEMQRRVFWILYQTDKTEAAVGLPSLMPDHEGVPPFPLEVDDEFITPSGNLPQPISRASTMTGLALSLRLFRTFSQCLTRHRTFTYTPSEAPDVETTLVWLEDARAMVRDTLRNLPAAWQAGLEDCWRDEEEGVAFGTQRANLLITAASLDFALLDLKSVVLPGKDITEEREMAARESYQMLSSIPIEHLAMNGESIRGKVLRIIISLMSTNSMQEETYSQSVKDWWSILSQVQWVQVIPLDSDDFLSS